MTGDLPTAEMNALELEMLWTLKFTLNVSREDYDDCVGDLREIQRTVVAQQDQANARTTPGLAHTSAQYRSEGASLCQWLPARYVV